MNLIESELLKNDEHMSECGPWPKVHDQDLSATGRMALEERYQERVAALVRELRDERQLTYEKLAEALAGMGVRIKPQVLANKINRGTFNAGFAVMVLEAMGYTGMDFPKPPARLKGRR